MQYVPPRSYITVPGNTFPLYFATRMPQGLSVDEREKRLK